ncbi:MAG: copper chaperone PCu(A)C, partial [Betaproteobacteria bacterium]
KIAAMRSLWMGVALAGALAGGAAAAHDFALKELRVGHPYARATPPGARAGGAYFTVENRGAQDDRLIAVASPVAAAAEIHSMAMEGNVMRMRAAGAIDLPAGARIALQPGGFHVMLLDLKRPLVAGERIPLTLTFERAGALEVILAVESMVPAATPAHPH